MAKLAHYARIQKVFDILLQDLSAAWPRQDLDYVREEVGHGEYGDALENLIALGLRNGASFSLNQAQQVEFLATTMGMENSPFVVKLREVGTQEGYRIKIKPVWGSVPRNQTRSANSGWIDSFKQVAMTFGVLLLIMIASALLISTVSRSPPTLSIEAGSSSSTTSQVISSGIFLLLLAGFAWWRVRPAWWRAYREMNELFN